MQFKKRQALEAAIRDNDIGSALSIIECGNYRHDPALQMMDATTSNNYSYVGYCALRGRPEILESLLRAGAPADDWVAGSFRPIHLACRRSNSSCVRLLLASGANPMVNATENLTLLHHGARDGMIVRALLDAGCDPMIQADDGQLPLHYAASYGEDPSVVRMLVGAGTPIEGTGATWKTPLYCFATCNTDGALAVGEELLSFGANPLHKTPGGRTVLQASYNGNGKIAALLANRVSSEELRQSYFPTNAQMPISSFRDFLGTLSDRSFLALVEAHAHELREDRGRRPGVIIKRLAKVMGNSPEKLVGEFPRSVVFTTEPSRKIYLLACMKSGNLDSALSACDASGISVDPETLEELRVYRLQELFAEVSLADRFGLNGW